MKRLLFVLTIALVALSLNSAPVAAQATGTTDLDITLNGIVILHYFSTVSVEISTEALSGYLAGGEDAIDEGLGSTGVEGGMTFNLSMDTLYSDLANDPTAVLLTLQNAWAVRSIGGANTQISIDSGGGDSLTNGGASIDIIGRAVSSVAGGGPSVAINFPSPGLVNPEVGDVLLTLNLTDATATGTYVNGDYVLEAILL